MFIRIIVFLNFVDKFNALEISENFILNLKFFFEKRNYQWH